MSYIIGFTLVIIFLYVFFIAWLIFNWKTHENLDFMPDKVIYPRVSVLVVARNEQANIIRCIQSIEVNDYPKDLFEIILVDDHSVDDTIEMINQLAYENLTIIELKNYHKFNANKGYKKQGIQFGVENSTADIVLCTDADCMVGPVWIKTVVQEFSNENVKFVTGPISYFRADSLLHSFQTQEMMGTMALTAWGIRTHWLHLANGANMAFRKNWFLRLNAYDQHSEYASGDDVFLIQRSARESKRSVKFLYNRQGIVKTTSQSNFKDLWNQRLRWATKTKAYNEIMSFVILAFIFGINIFLLYLILAGFFIDQNYLRISAGFFFIKALIDYNLVKSTAKFFDRKIKVGSFIVNLMLFWLYILILPIAGLFIKKYIWKGRTQQ